MATRLGCRDASPEERRSPVGLRGAPPDSPPVLTLSHFCPKPFLCFGDVRVGASRSMPLAVLNPNSEAAAVTLRRDSAAAARGFHVCPGAFDLQPMEKIVISVNWTPLEGGRVREILTFLVNGILKHKVVLLGNAEEPRKKKRSLWDTMKKKKVSASSSHKKKISNSQNVNQTFSVSQKVDRVRSPLQACENLGRNEACSPTENTSLILEENKIPISPISPTFKECHGDTCLPLCVRRSTTYTSLHAPENGELWKLEGAHISKDFNDRVIPETSFSSVNNISGQIEEDSKLTFTRHCSSALNVTQNQGNFLSPDSFVKNSHAADKEIETMANISSDMFVKDKDNSRPVHLESKAVHELYQTILSPDSFIKDNYGLNQEPKSELMNLILSPNQFVKDNMKCISISQQTCALSPLSKENFQNSQSQGQRKSEVLLYIPKCQGSNSPSAIFEEPKALGMKPNCYTFTKQNLPQFSAVQGISGYGHSVPHKRRPVLSATVTKLKSTGTRENKTETSKVKAKRCLHSIVGECEKLTDNLEEKNAFHSYLPVIDPVVSQSNSCKKVTPSSKTAFIARKRKSEGSREDANVITVTEEREVQEIKRIHLSPLESKTLTAKKTKKLITPVSQRISREKPNLKKKTDSLAYKTPNPNANKRTKRIVAVAQSNLTFIKPLKTDIPRHPMPFAAKNMFYDERWKEKQQQGFTWWLNFILTPDDFTVKTKVSEVNAATLFLGVENQHKLSVPRAPTKDEVSLRAYTARCRLNRLRRTACRLFTSERMVKAIKRLEIEIEGRRLLVRKDRHLWKDVGERQKVLNWLLSYNPLWLRIGLETVYGELIALEDNSDVMGLAVFILNRLLWNPDIAADFRHPSVPHLYRDGHEEALSKFTLKKLLLLVCFLDYAKVSRLIDHDPCLFCKDAEFKTSKEILLAFSRDFLSGEGDLSRHLSLLGLPVTHVQTPLDEFDFAVTNLAVDLQCGVRLVRAMELLTRSWDLSGKLRVPAISRLQKMHNVDVALQALRSRGVQLEDEHGNAILPKDIVDRHREKTLALLWKIALAFQVDISLNLDELREEIDFLKRTWRMKKAMSELSGCAEAAVSKKAEPGQSSTFEQYSESVVLLMAWANAVCAFYNKKVENFTVSFSDGRVLCYLIHHYHPCYVPFDAICQRTTQTVECVQTGAVVLNSSSESDESCLDVSLKALDHGNTLELHKELLENEKKNFQLVRSAVRDLGGIPAMIHHADMSNTIPDEKVVITYLSFLCARLLDLRRETRAARLIQATWRKYKLKADLKCRQERDKAARIIQSAIINFLTKRRLKKEVNAAVVIQKHWRRLREQRNLLMLKKENLEKVQNKSASVIQRYWRRYSSRKRFLQLKKYSVILQSRIRMIIAVAAFKQYLWAAVTIQRYWRAYVRGKRDRQRYETLRSSCLAIQSVFRRRKHCKAQLQRKAAITLQRAFRDWRTRKLAKEEKSATVIQSWYRMHRELRKYHHIRSCVIVIQAWFRCCRAQKLYKRRKESVLTLQRRWQAHLKGKVARTDYLQKRAMALRLQAMFRAARARNLHRQVRAACVLQSHWRVRCERLRFLSLKKGVIKLQAHVRKHQQRQKYQRLKTATLVIQTHFRAHVSAKKALASYQRTRSAVIVLQSAYRGMRARRKFAQALAAVKIQSYYRAYSCRKTFLSLKCAAVQLQSIVRMKQTRKQYLYFRAATLLIQQRYRALRAAAQQREEYSQVRGSCIRLQALARGYLVRKQMRSQRKAATSLQAYFRMRKTRQNYLRMCKAALVIQNYYRTHHARVRQRKQLQVQRAATCLQAAYRGYKVRQRIRQQSRAALRIQAAFRGCRERVKYQSLLQSTVKIQRWYRAHRTVSDLRIQFVKTRTAVISLQSAYHGWKVRKQMGRELQAVLKIQSVFRMVKAREQFLALKRAALVLQRSQRARAAGREQRTQYLELRQAVLVLQSAWRRRDVWRRLHRNAVVIQAHYRMYVQRTRWRAVQQAVRLIQLYYRAYSLGRRQRLLYLKTKAAVVILQRAYRRMRARRQRTQARAKAAVTIQARYRASRVRRRYAACRAAALAIQRWYRNTKVADHQRKEYFNLKKAATQMQAVYRGIRVRRHVQHMHMAATLIKAMFKMHQSKTRYCKMRKAAIIIQVRYRAYRQGKAQHTQYLAILTAVNILQASFRGARVRWTLRKMREAAVLIQAHYRGHREQAYFSELKKAAEVVQRRYRALKARNTQFRRYNNTRHSVLRIQAAFRGMKARRRLKVMHLAAALIQRRFRAVMMRRRFLSLRETAVWVQRKYRANIQTKQHLQFLRFQKAAIKIQSLFRGWVVRKKLQEMHRAACVIQAMFRMHRAHARYRALKHASILIQQRYRACRAAQSQRENYIRLRHSAVVIQAAYKEMKARRLSKEKHRAAVVIQSTYRMHRQYIFYQKIQWATEVIQEKYRANGKKALEPNIITKACIQAGFQKVMATGQQGQEYQAAVIIQKHFRAFRIRKSYLRFRAAVIFVQRRFRVLTAARAQAATCLRSSCRGCEMRRDIQCRHRAATLIEAFYMAEAEYQARRRAAVVIQNRYRSYARMTTGGKQLLAVVQKSEQTCQGAFRGVGVRWKLGNTSEEEMAASPASRCEGARTPQGAAQSSVFRPQTWSEAPRAAGSWTAECRSPSEAAVTTPEAVRKRVTGQLDTQKWAALQIQSFLRMAVCRCRFIQQKRAAVTLQLSFRAWQTRRRFLRLRKAAVVLQNRHRACLSTKHQRQVYIQIRSSVIAIQARMRGFLQKRKFQRIKQSTLKIQAAWRSYKARKHGHEAEAACKIQAWYRCWRARKEYLAILGAVRVTQGCFCTRQARTRFLNLRASAVIIQRKWRAILSGRTAREHFLMMKILEERAQVRLLRFTAAACYHLSAVRIQRAYRRYAVVKIAKKHVDSVICIQRWFRTRLQLKRFIHIYRSIINIQHEVQECQRRQNRAASVIQKAVRRFLLQKRQEKFSNGIIKIQALWRGYSWRKKSDCTKIKAIRKSLQTINGEIREENKLYKRTALALHHLLTYKHLSAVLEALKHLEVVTRLSPLCCENMAQSGAVSKVFVLIRSCNRSVPCMEVISYAVQVLLNVAKYEKTASAVYDVENCVDTLLELLQMYREKPGDKVADKSSSIFTRTCCLLAVLLKVTSRASDVRNRSRIVDCVYSIYKLTARKHRINIERILYKQKNSSVNIPFIPETPVRTRIVSRLKPDWVLRRDNMEEITNPLQAIQMVMDTLGLPC